MIKKSLEIKKLVQKIFKKMKIGGELVAISQDDCLKLNLKNSDDSALLIGYQGETLRALQLAVRIILQNQRLLEDGQRIIVDIDSYLDKKDESLKELAQKAAKNVLQSKHPEELRPMTAYERRIIHLALEGEKIIITESIGEEPARRIVIRLK